MEISIRRVSSALRLCDGWHGNGNWQPPLVRNHGALFHTFHLLPVVLIILFACCFVFIGLQHILCEDSIASSDQYAYFLDTLQSAHGCMTWSKDQLSDLSLHVIGHGSVSPQPYTVHDLFGLMHVPASATRNELSEFILDKGDLARHRTKMYEDAAQQERATVLQCKRVLQLLALERDDDVSAEQMQHCCDRMLAASDQLAPLLRYMSIRVSNRFHMDDDDKTLYLKWNWM
eukprot:TRINITY_DN58_c0_g1_i2.p2 TRINITY_DN58_c0_g1~~TRINITY_DN58_c0_g1_i2.p2  ORF type:complete len:231 (+),score=33.23 TRINITY_DN58_c0_g1_i2:976-1668(+)